MARRPRLLVPALPLHIIQRGNNRNPCFASEADYFVYLSLLQQYAVETTCQIHAYVLMTNHVHLLLSADDITGPSVLMRRLGQHYVQYFNRRHQRTGTLWEGRFRSCVVDHDHYFLVCQRYIELNPVRAGMVQDPGGYPWSSYRTNALGDANPLITPHAVYMGLGLQDADRQASYRNLFTEVISAQLIKQIRHASNSNLPLGSVPFTEHIRATLGRALPTGRRGRPKNSERKLP
jgi:putative transposase